MGLIFTNQMCTYIVVCQAHMEAVHADWKEYLNLLICEENHLKHMDEYHKVRHRGQMSTHRKLHWIFNHSHTHTHTHTHT